MKEELTTVMMTDVNPIYVMWKL